MKKLNDSQMLQVQGGLGRCFWAGLASVANPMIGVAIAGGFGEYWDCIVAV